METKFPPKLDLDSNSDSANQYYKHGFGQHGPQTSQGNMPIKQSFAVIGGSNK